MSANERTPRETCESVLTYLERRRSVAEHKQNRWLEVEFREAWMLAFETFYGPNPQPFPMPHVRDDSVRMPRRKTAYQLQNLRRPCRKVVGVILARESKSQSRRQGGGTAREVLECGHYYDNPLLLLEGTPNKWRRCPGCEKERLVIIAAQQIGAAA